MNIVDMNIDFNISTEILPAGVALEPSSSEIFFGSHLQLSHEKKINQSH